MCLKRRSTAQQASLAPAQACGLNLPCVEGISNGISLGFKIMAASCQHCLKYFHSSCVFARKGASEAKNNTTHYYNMNYSIGIALRNFNTTHYYNINYSIGIALRNCKLRIAPPHCYYIQEETIPRLRHATQFCVTDLSVSRSYLHSEMDYTTTVLYSWLWRKTKVTDSQPSQ